jgi:Protein of unknown function (DUF1573)
MNAILPLVLLAVVPGQPPAAVLRAAAPVADKGEVMSGPPLTHVFDLTHSGEKGVVALTGIDAGCGCLKAEATPRVLKPGETAKVTVTVNTLTQPEGPVTWTGTVKYAVDNGPQQDVTVKLTAKLVREIAVTPPMLAVSTTGAVRQVITVTDRRATPLTVTKATATNPAFTAEVKPADTPPAGRRQEIVLSVSADLPAGAHEDTLTLTTSDPLCPELRVPVKVLKRAPGELTATPDALSIRTNAKQTETSAAAVIRAEGKAVSIQKVECDKPGVTVRHSEGSGPLATVRVLVNPAKAGASGATEVIVTLAEPPGKTVIIPVTWYAP